MSDYRVTKNVLDKDIEEIFDDLKGYNLSKLEYSEIIPVGIFKEGARYVFVDTFDFQAPEFYMKHGYKQVFELSEYPKTGIRHYYTKEL